MTRIRPGYYKSTINGCDYYVRFMGGDVRGYDVWVWYADGESANDTYPTKRDAVAALKDWTKSSA